MRWIRICGGIPSRIEEMTSFDDHSSTVKDTENIGQSLYLGTIPALF